MGLCVYLYLYAATHVKGDNLYEILTCITCTASHLMRIPMTTLKLKVHFSPTSDADKLTANKDCWQASFVLAILPVAVDSIAVATDRTVAGS